MQKNTEMKQEMFMFHKAWRDAVRELPNEVRLELYESLMDYAFSGIIKELGPLARVAFNFIRPDIDRGNSWRTIEPDTNIGSTKTGRIV